jgi:hypothetical protein
MAHIYSLFTGLQAPRLQPCHPREGHPSKAEEVIPMLGGSTTQLLDMNLGTTLCQRLV